MMSCSLYVHKICKSKEEVIPKENTFQNKENSNLIVFMKEKKKYHSNIYLVEDGHKNHAAAE